jgi:hypothetical protein
MRVCLRQKPKPKENKCRSSGTRASLKDPRLRGNDNLKTKPSSALLFYEGGHRHRCITGEPSRRFAVAGGAPDVVLLLQPEPDLRILNKETPLQAGGAFEGIVTPAGGVFSGSSC